MPATGTVEVPDDAIIHLDIQAESSGEAWAGRDSRPADLACLLELPPDAIHSISLIYIEPTSVSALPHLHAGLRRVYLCSTGLTDEALPYVARLRGLTYLQSWGNEFTSEGVQQLVSLQDLERLYLEEETLDYSAFEFVGQLPRLRRLGVKDVPLTGADLARLTARLPQVDVG